MKLLMMKRSLCSASELGQEKTPVLQSLWADPVPLLPELSSPPERERLPRPPQRIPGREALTSVIRSLLLKDFSVPEGQLSQKLHFSCQKLRTPLVPEEQESPKALPRVNTAPVDP